MRRRVLFRLTMPGVGSWNGRWSGEGKNYVIVRSVDTETTDGWGMPASWRYAWDDGWAACVTARFMEKGERKPKSDGFYGYDWMVANIIRWGTPECQHEFRPDPKSGEPGWEGEWVRCRWCSMGRRTAAPEPTHV